jgi:glucan phosphoethanolaminetransferase (alkaline phosphatase superfamily)
MKQDSEYQKLAAADYTYGDSSRKNLVMDRQILATLEQAMEPYRQAGFILTFQSEGAITLAYPRAKFNYLLFLILLLVWPLALLYLISFNNRGSKGACLRVTSQGQIEESGYTLAAAERDRKRGKMFYSIILAILIAILIFLILWILRMMGIL